MNSRTLHVALLAAAVSAGCGASSSGGASAQDGGHASDSGITCYLDGGLWHCPGGGAGVLSCPGIANPDTLCDYSGGSCFYCSIAGTPGPGNPGTGSGCTCDHFNSAALDAGASATWDCIASNWLCQ